MYTVLLKIKGGGPHRGLFQVGDEPVTLDHARGFVPVDLNARLAVIILFQDAALCEHLGHSIFKAR